MRQLSLLLAVAAVVSGGAVTSKSLQPQGAVLLETAGSEAANQATANVFGPSIVRLMTFLQSSMNGANVSPKSVKGYKSFLDNCQGTFKDIYPSDLCVDIAEVHKESFLGQDMFGAKNIPAISQSLSDYLLVQEGAHTAQIAADVNTWVDGLQHRIESVRGSLFHQSQSSHGPVAMQLGVLCAQLPESHSHPDICPKFVSAYNTLFANEDVFSDEGGTKTAFLSTLTSIVVLERKQARAHLQAKAKKQTKGGAMRMKQKQKQYPGQSKGGEPAFSQGPSYSYPYPPRSYQAYQAYRRAAPRTKGTYYAPDSRHYQPPHQHEQAEIAAGGTLNDLAGPRQQQPPQQEPAHAGSDSEVDVRGLSTIPDNAPIVTDGGLDVPLSFRLGYPTIANRALDLSVFKTQVREDCAFALKTTVERFAVVSVEPSFNNRYVNVVLRIYPVAGGGPPTAGQLLESMKRQILNEVSPLRLGIATRHLFIPGDTSGKHFTEVYVHPNYRNSARSTTPMAVLVAALLCCAALLRY